MNYDNRVKIEGKLQLKLWTNKEFWELYAETYYLKDYNKWWFEKGAKKSMKNSTYSNNFWKNKIN